MNIKTKFSVVIVSLMITMNIAIAGNTVQLGTNRVGIHVTSPDDHIICSLNGRVIAQSNFGDPEKDIELTSQLVPGANPVRCIALDDNNGTCFRYGYQIWTQRNSGPRQLDVNEYYQCCDDSCRRNGNPVLDETVWINK